MIIVRITGGLGNQMAQYAFGCIVAKKLNTKLVLDKNWYKTQPINNDYRTFQLDYFNEKLVSLNKLETLWYKIKTKSIKESYPQSINLNLLDQKKNYYFDGYWLHLDYFKENFDLIKSLFVFKSAVGSVKDWENIISDTNNSISLHIRRGDYAYIPKINSIFGVLPITYYGQALSYYCNKYDNPKFFVFSNDLPWAKANLPHGFSYAFVEHNRQDYEDLRLMSLCQHHIVANSTFSWWGAWLNRNPNKVVVAPKKWFINGLSSSAFVSSDWIKL